MTPHSRHTPQSLHALWASLALFAALAGALAVLVFPSTGAAAAATKCGDKVLADWFDNGRIDRLYPLHCYEEAIDAIPDDLKDYADAEEVIGRALQFALRDELDPAGGVDPTPGEDDPRKGGAPAGGNNNGGSSGGGTTEATPDIDTGGPSSVPIPLLVLAGISLALLAAGGLGYVSRRRQAAREVGDDFDDPTLL